MPHISCPDIASAAGFEVFHVGAVPVCSRRKLRGVQLTALPRDQVSEWPIDKTCMMEDEVDVLV